ncbi:TRAP transporter substrate-binding protein [Thermodesulfobacteriota bacterium]
MAKRLVSMVVCFIFVSISGISAWAAEKPIIIRYANSFHPKHTYSMADKDYFAMIEKQTNGRVKFQPFWGATLISRREGYTDISKGVCDIGQFSGSYSKSGHHIARRVLGFYHGIQSYDVRTDIFLRLLKKYPQYADEYKKIKPVGITSGMDYTLMSKKPIRTLDDMKGLQFKATATYIQVLTDLGAVGQSVPMGEVYMALQKGIIDGCMAPYETLKSFRFAEVVKGVTESPILTGAWISRGMNWDFWNKLPPDVQKVFDDNILPWAKLNKEYAAKADQLGIDLAKKQGVVFPKFSKSDLERFNAAIEKVCRVLAKDLDAKGYPGTAIYNDIRKWGKEAGY